MRKFLPRIALAILSIILFADNFSELQILGWNVPTLSFLGMMVFALLGAWGLIDQESKIWGSRSGEAVSIAWFSVFLFMFASTFVYGLEQNSLALLFHGAVRVIFTIPVLWGLWRYKEWNRREKALFFFLMIGFGINIFSPWKAFFFLAFTYMGIGSAIVQFLELLRARTTGKVSVKLIVIYTVSSVFWILYAKSFDEAAIEVVSWSYFSICSLTIALWFLRWLQERSSVWISGS